LRNHLLAATMRGRWETLTEIKRAIHKQDGMRFDRADIWTCLWELSIDGVHTLEFRQRDQSDHKEYRLRVKPDAIMTGPRSSLPLYIREQRAKPVRFSWPKPALR